MKGGEYFIKGQYWKWCGVIVVIAWMSREMNEKKEREREREKEGSVR